MIRIDQVTKRFGSKTVLSSITLALDSQRMHVLLGSSGSGKSTLLKLISGTMDPDAGSIFIDELRVCQRDQLRVSERLGYMTQEGGLFPHLTASENVALVARVRGWKPAAIRSRLEELSAIVGLDESLLGQYPSRLSGGQRQRLALIRALFLRPGTVLLDEPLGALDPIIRRELQTTLKSVFERLGTTVILVTHDVGEAAFFGDTVTLLYQGQVLQHARFEELARRPAHPYVTEFLMAQRPVPQLEALGT